MSYTVHQAKTHLSRILKEVEAGKEVIVTRGKKPVAKITAIDGAPASAPDPNFRLAGAYRGRMRWDEDAFDPITDEELAGMGLGYMLDARLMQVAAPKDQ